MKKFDPYPPLPQKFRDKPRLNYSDLTDLLVYYRDQCHKKAELLNRLYQYLEPCLHDDSPLFSLPIAESSVIWDIENNLLYSNYLIEKDV